MNKETTVLTKRDDYTIGLLQWIRDNPGLWQGICTPGDKLMYFETMKELIEQLSREGFYDIILVLLTVHRHNSNMKNALEGLMTEMFLAGWQEEVYDKEQIMEALMHFLT